MIIILVSKKPYLFLNCLGSYFYYICEERKSLYGCNPLLYCLAGYKLAYKNLDIKKSGRRYNSWEYQPIIFLNSQNKEMDFDTELKIFLEKNLDMEINKEEMSSNFTLYEKMRYDLKEGYYCICKIDEFHIIQSKKFFQKSSNRHYLLIKSFEDNKKEIKVVDSEIGEYNIKFDVLNKAFYDNEFKHKNYYSIRWKNTISPINIKYNISLFDSNAYTISYLFDLLNEIRNCKMDDYIFCGYQYNIASKIIPYMEMRYRMNLHKNDVKQIEKTRSILKKWNDLNILMIYKRKKKEYDYKFIENRIVEIVKQEEAYT